MDKKRITIYVEVHASLIAEILSIHFRALKQNRKNEYFLVKKQEAEEKGMQRGMQQGIASATVLGIKKIHRCSKRFRWQR